MISSIKLSKGLRKRHPSKIENKVNALLIQKKTDQKCKRENLKKKGPLCIGTLTLALQITKSFPHRIIAKKLGLKAYKKIRCVSGTLLSTLEMKLFFPMKRFSCHRFHVICTQNDRVWSVALEYISENHLFIPRCPSACNRRKFPLIFIEKD